MNLVTVQGDMTLEPLTAAAWQSMKADARSEFGVDLTISSPAGAYRSDALVRDMYLNKAKYGIKKSQPVAKPRSLGGPGSVHESGRCIDVWNHTAIPRKSLVALAARHGFRFTIASEPWHMQHDGSGGGSTGGGTAAKPSLRKGKQMSQVLITTFKEGLADVDPRVAKLRGYVGGGTVTKFSAGVGVIALVGDSPGTAANVQVTQSDRRGNEWAADHSGSWGNIGQAARAYELDEFLALCDAYLAPIVEQKPGTK